jgi:hypothetical protein
MRRLLAAMVITIAAATLTPSPATAATAATGAPASLLAPSSCAAIKAANPAATDGTYAILPAGLLGGLLGGLLNVFCGDMATSPKEYITLAHTGPGQNFSEYAAGGASDGTNVVTRYTKIRFNPVPISLTPITFEANDADETYSTSTGTLCHSEALPCSGGLLVTSMPYGVAAGCDSSANGSANIDFGGTPFDVVNSFGVGGFEASGTATAVSRQVINATGGGFCGWNSISHVYQPYNFTGGWDLHLTLDLLGG